MDITEITQPVQYRIEESHLKQRRVFLWGQVDDRSARHVIDRLLLLSATDSEYGAADADVTLIINSPGGANTAGFAILDTMRSLPCDVRTECYGLAASFGALLLLCGASGKRSAHPHSRIMIHQPWIPGEIRAPALDLRIHAAEIEKQRREINAIIASVTGNSVEQIEADTDRDRWFDAAEALQYGLIDSICE